MNYYGIQNFMTIVTEIKKNIILKDLGEKLACSANEVQRKIHNLRNQVSKELKKTKQTKSGSGTDEIYFTKWPYFNGLKFLIPFLSGSSTQSNLEIISLDKSVEEILVISESENINASGESKKGELKTKKDKDIKKKSNRYSKRKYETEREENVFEAALKVLKKEPDEYDVFAEYVAQELRSLRSDVLKRKLKSEIRKAIVRIADDDDLFSYGSSSSIAPSPCPTNASSIWPEQPNFSINPQAEDLPSAENLQSTQNYYENFRYEKL